MKIGSLRVINKSHSTNYIIQEYVHTIAGNNWINCFKDIEYADALTAIKIMHKMRDKK